MKELGFTHIMWDSEFGRGSDRQLAKTVGEDARVEGQLDALTTEGKMDLIYQADVTVLTSRILSKRRNAYVRIYQIR